MDLPLMDPIVQKARTKLITKAIALIKEIDNEKIQEEIEEKEIVSLLDKMDITDLFSVVILLARYKEEQFND